MNPPNVYELIIPKNQRINSKMAIVQSIGTPFVESVYLLSQHLDKVYAGDIARGIQ
jgi:hypothetical protein